MADTTVDLILHIGGDDFRGCISVTGTPDGVAKLLRDVEAAARRCDPAAWVEVKAADAPQATP